MAVVWTWKEVNGLKSYLDDKIDSTFWPIRYELVEERGVENKNTKKIPKFLFWVVKTAKYFL